MKTTNGPAGFGHPARCNHLTHSMSNDSRPPRADSRDVTVGIDAGGSSTRARAVHDGAIMHEGTGGPGNPVMDLWRPARSWRSGSSRGRSSSVVEMSAR